MRRALRWLVSLAAVFGLSCAMGLALAEAGSSDLAEKPRAVGLLILENDRSALPARIDVAVDDAQLQRDIATHIALLKHPQTLIPLVADPMSPLRQTRWFAGFKDNPAQAATWLQEHVHVEPVTGSRLIRIWVGVADAPDDARAIVEQVGDRYLQEEQRLQSNRTLDRTTALNNLKIKFETKIRELQDRQNNRMMQLNLGAIGTPERYTTTDLELRDAMRKQAGLGGAAAAAGMALDTLKQQIEQGADPAAVLEALDRDPLIARCREQILELDVQSKLAPATQPGEPESPAASDLRRKREAYSDALTRARAERLLATRAALITEARLKAEVARQAMDSGAHQIEQLKGVLGDLSIAMSDYLTIVDELKNTRDSLKNVKDELDRISSQSSVPRITWAARPAAAGG